MKNYYLWVFVTVMLLGAETLTSAEIIPVWHKVNGEGMPEDMIHDIEFLRGEDQFIMIAGVNERGAIQIRDTQTGELVSSFPLHTLNQFNQIEITPDSNRCIITTGGSRLLGPTIELRNLSDYSIISKDSLEMDGEAKDPEGNPYQYRFHDMIVDPVRPLVYVLVEKTAFSGKKDRFYLKVYNYETMQLMKDITPSDFNDNWPSKELIQEDDNYCIDVSDDGKYLASLSGGESYLNVWDLQTMELIHKVQLFDSSLEDPRCEVQDIEFSSIDKDLIYYSGKFPIHDEPTNPNGIFNYYMSNDLREVIPPIEKYSDGKFLLFDQENRLMVYNYGVLIVINKNESNIELYKDMTFEFPFGTKTLYGNLTKEFIGFSNQYIGSIRYDSQSFIETEFEKEIRISPNPTSSFVNVNLNCTESQINYQINDIKGILIFKSFIQNENGKIQIDFSPFPIGVYFLNISCNNQTRIYKIIKDG